MSLTSERKAMLMLSASSSRLMYCWILSSRSNRCARATGRERHAPIGISWWHGKGARQGGTARRHGSRARSRTRARVGGERIKRADQEAHEAERAQHAQRRAGVVAVISKEGLDDEVDDLEWNGRHEIEHEPAAQIVVADHRPVEHKLVALEVGRVEVEAATIARSQSQGLWLDGRWHIARSMARWAMAYTRSQMKQKETATSKSHHTPSAA